LKIRAILDGDRGYEDLYLYRTQVVPQAEVLLDLLQEVTTRQQARLQADLARARASLERSRTQTVAGGLLALALGVAMAFLLGRSIVGPAGSGKTWAIHYVNAALGNDGRMLLIDDVLTTGSTLSECARVLKRAGAKL